MFKNNAKQVKTETVEEAIARGVVVQKFAEGDSHKRKRRKPLQVDAQKLIDNCKNEYEEQSVIDFLKSQGVEVE